MWFLDLLIYLLHGHLKFALHRLAIKETYDEEAELVLEFRVEHVVIWLVDLV